MTSEPILSRTITRLLAAIPDFGLAGFFLISWIAPYTFGSHIVPRLVLMMLMEFVIVHSSAFLTLAMVLPKGRPARIAAVLGLGLVYSIFAGAWSFIFKTWGRSRRSGCCCSIG